MKTPEFFLSDPVVAAVSAPDETRWGFTQFPALSRLPDGRILLCYADAEDASETHGNTAPALVSADEGETWQSFAGEPDPVRPHYAITEAYDGEFFAVPSIRYFDVKKAGIALPEPVAESFVYGSLYTYRAVDFPAEVLDHFRWLGCKRWTPGSGTWVDEKVEYETKDLLVWRREDSDLLPRAFFERPALRHRGEILYADYRVRYALKDGFVAQKGGTDLMASSDNGRTFEHRATVAVDRSGRDLMGEPTLAETTEGELVCVIRKTDHEQKPMVITRSSDGGRTWTDPVEFCEFGVFPCLQKLKSGPLVLSYGRPGVHLRISPDGNGREWSEPVTLISGDPAEVSRCSCGYTSLLELSDNSLLIAYSDFEHVDAGGTSRKAILTRRVKVG
ncbi:MAG: hypothetical protein DRP71_11495 [Verrucomicrobia bacterium]|nr:MAG: hypothetical protein DRP71_11495 [Verrucomicrobiota bacterium]